MYIDRGLSLSKGKAFHYQWPSSFHATSFKTFIINNPWSLTTLIFLLIPFLLLEKSYLFCSKLMFSLHHASQAIFQLPLLTKVLTAVYVLPTNLSSTTAHQQSSPLQNSGQDVLRSLSPSTAWPHIMLREQTSKRKGVVSGVKCGHLVYDPLWANFCVRSEVLGKVHFGPVDIQLLHLLERPFSLHWIAFCTFVKNQLTILVWGYSWVSLLVQWFMCLSFQSSATKSWLL